MLLIFFNMKLILYSMKPGYCQQCDSLTDLLNYYKVPHEKLILGEHFTQEQFISKFGRGKGFPFIVNENSEDLGSVLDVVNIIIKHKLYDPTNE